MFLEFVILILDFDNLDRLVVKKLKKIDFLRTVTDRYGAEIHFVDLFHEGKINRNWKIGGEILTWRTFFV